MPSRRRRTFVRRRKLNLSRKRQRPMDFDRPSDQIASPHEGDLHIENEVNLEPTIKRLFLWCYNKLPSVRGGISYASAIFASSHSLQASLEATRSELDETKLELKRISEKLNLLEFRMKEFSNQSKSCQPLVAVPLAPPPPPPPPVPVLKPLPVLVLKNKSMPLSKNMSKKKEANSKQTLCISLDDILKVKLKKTMLNTVPGKENKLSTSQRPMNQPRVTLSDITSVTLRSSQQDTTSGEENSTPKSVLLRRTLRPTTMKRSPGGTPIVNRDHTRSTATGPTPEIERALRRKFRSIRTSPLAEDDSVSSPTSDATRFY